MKWLIISLTLVPYSFIFIARSLGLFYMPDKEDSNLIEEESNSQGKFIKDYQ